MWKKSLGEPSEAIFVIFLCNRIFKQFKSRRHQKISCKCIISEADDMLLPEIQKLHDQTWLGPDTNLLTIKRVSGIKNVRVKSALTHTFEEAETLLLE